MSMKTYKNAASLAAFVLLAGVASASFAVTGGADDCTDPLNPATCDHPNVGMLSGFDEDGITAPGTRCTVSLLHYDEKKAVFLTASHCLEDHIVENTASRGVNLDAEVNKLDAYSFDDTRFIKGALYAQYPGWSFPGNDIGLVFFEMTDELRSRLEGLQKIAIPPVANYVKLMGYDTPSSKLQFTGVGYGLGDVVARAKTGGNKAGGAQFDADAYASFGVRSVSNSVNLLGKKTVVNDDNYLTFNQTPAEDKEGLCFGDSGGPIIDPDGYVVAIVSWGTNYKCTGIGGGYRVDLEDSLNMIHKCALDEDLTAEAGRDCVVNGDFQN